MKLHFRIIVLLIFIPAVLSVLPAQERVPDQDQDQPLAFRTAIELALRNSAASGISRNDLLRAKSAVSQARDFFLPQASIGSGLGYSFGFPLSLEGAAPSIFQVYYQEGLLNLAQREYIKAARSDVKTAEAQGAERRSAIIMETALSYMQLDLLDSFIPVQKEQQAAATKYQDVAAQRVEAGLDSQVELTRAKLAVARTRLDIEQAHAAADQLRLRLSQLTGLPVSAIRTSTETIPRLPEVSQDDDLASLAEENNPSVKVAEFAAQAKEHRAKAEHKQLYPSVDAVAQYAVLSRINNYDQFFLKFQRNNVTAGGTIRFNFLNPGQHDAAKVARFDANKAREEARNLKQQVGAETLKLQRSIRQLAAAREVAKLEHELAQADIDAVRARIESGEASLKDEQDALVTEHQRYTAYLNSSFALDKAQVELLREIGDLESWATGPKR